MPFVPVDDLTLYYEEHGQPDGPPLVLLHGFLATTHFWRAQLAAFGAHYRLIVPELRGHGRTNNPAGLPAMRHHQFARDIISMCRALALEQPVLCGESTGAMLQLWLALEAPELAKAHILAGGTFFYGPQLRAWWAEQTPETIWQGQPAERLARHSALGPQHWREVAAAFIALGNHSHRDDFPDAEALRGVRAPALIIHGDRDRFFPVAVPAELYSLLPDAELCILPNTGHLPPSERPEWFNAIVLEFLQRRFGA